MTSDRSRTIIDKIFSYDVLKDLDRDALVKKHDVTDAIDEINAPLRSQAGPIAQPEFFVPALADFIIMAIPPEGLTLGYPGTYKFAGDLVWQPDPAKGAGAAITIVASGVVLDMGGHTLKAVVQDSSQSLAGIYAHGAMEITIKNGMLVDMGYYGVCAETIIGLTIENVTVSGLVFRNLNRRSLCPAGIFVKASEGVTISGCSVQYVYATADTCAGIFLLETSLGMVSGCRVSDLVNYDGVAAGYYYMLSSAIATSDCHVKNLQTYFNGNIRSAGHTAIGFLPCLSMELTFEGCSASNITGSCDDCHGMSVFIVALVKVKNFTAHAITDGPPPYNTGAKATGLEVYGALISVEDSSVENIKAINPQDKQATGFSVWGWDIAITNCTATNVVVCDENGGQNPALGYGTGFGWAPDPRITSGAYYVTYERCSALNCQVGFDTWMHVDSKWIDPQTSDCKIPILVQPGESRTLSGNPASECNPPITVVVKNIASGNEYPPP